ncbi:phenylacetate--CoA ligase family protein [Candidatus Woesearchaeota archaeon]|nr:phenylacetate--CoA ligase family protein [Candidatus Woesearchaeota archaeon]
MGESSLICNMAKQASRDREIDYSQIGRPQYREQTPADLQELLQAYLRSYQSIRYFRFRDPIAIREWQFKKIRHLVTHAFAKVPLYREKYAAAGLHPGDLRTWRDFELLPFVTKDELIAAWPNAIIAQGYTTEFTTRSSGSSGKFVTVAVDKQAVITDTLMGCRQIEAQSGGTVSSSDSSLLIYTCPWWFTSIGGLYPTIFISSGHQVEDAAAAVRALRPAVLSLYPSYLQRLAPQLQDIQRVGGKLVIVHSEQSTRTDREELSAVLRVLVLDEYSSEELTRIALECPKRRYHLEEDSCYLEIIDHQTGLSSKPGDVGEVVGTNLLNMATPLIRYKQGDLSSFPTHQEPCSCGSSFRQLSGIEGRVADCLVTPSGKLIPSGSLMDAAYRWFLDLSIPVHGIQYEIVQIKSGKVHVNLVSPYLRDSEQRESIRSTIQQQLQEIFNNECDIDVGYVDSIPARAGKHRPIRRE